MSDLRANPPLEPPRPGEQPPRRLLERPPGERFATAATPPTVSGSAGRAAVLGAGAGVVGVAAHVAGSLLLLLVGPLILVASTFGFAVGAFVRLGAGAGPGSPGAAARRLLGIGIAVGAVAVGLAVAWAASGRYLGPLEFLDQVYGLSVPLQFAGAAAGSLAGTR